jgi:3-deoxy-manno-octulosonate cytidylyltransferase (CMP-KDO synthetase)
MRPGTSGTSGVAVIVPARYHSSRFPGKPLAVIAGRTLVEWVHRRASEVRGVSRVLVATDDERIASAVRAFGGEVVMTSSDHPTGTDRVAAVARTLDEDRIVNLQGDEPVFPPRLVEEMIDAMRGDIDIVTPFHRITRAEDVVNPNVVKVVMDGSRRAMYFSRSPIPFVKTDHTTQAGHYRHIGIYVFKKESLLRFARTEPSPLEKAESLEQLRALENGMTIQLVETEYATLGVDSPEDMKDVEKALTATYSL